MKRALLCILVTALLLPFASLYAQDDDMMGIYGINAETVELIEDDPSNYYGETVTIDGVASEIVDANTFTIVDTEPFDLTPATFYIVDSTGESFTGFGVDINEDVFVRVTGTLQEAVVVDLEDQSGIDLDDAAYDSFAADDNFAIVANNVQMIDAVGGTMVDGVGLADDPDISASAGVGDGGIGVFEERCSAAYAGENFLGLQTEVMELIEDNPQSFFGTQVTVEGYVEQLLGVNGFVLQDNEPFDFTPPEFVVADAQGDEFSGLTLTEDTNVCVTGTIYDLGSDAFAQDLSYQLDDEFFEFGSGDDLFALVADNVQILDEEGAIFEGEPIDAGMTTADNEMMALTETELDEECSAASAGDNIFGLRTEISELVEDNPEEFFGTRITVLGTVEEILNENGFILQENEPFDFTPPEFFAADPEGDGFDVAFEEGDSACVTGVVYDLTEEGFTGNLGYTPDDTIFEFPSGNDRFALVVEDVRITDD